VPLPQPTPVAPVAPRVRVSTGLAAGELHALLQRSSEREPSTSDLRIYFESKNARAVTHPGRTLAHPPWATIVRGADSIFIELDSDAPERLVGVQLAEDESNVFAELTFAGARVPDLVEALRTFEWRRPLKEVSARTRGCQALEVDIAIGSCLVRLVAEHRSDVLDRVEVTFHKRVGRDKAAPPAVSVDAFERVLAKPGSIAARRALLAEWKAKGDPRAELLEQGLAYAEYQRTYTPGAPMADALQRAIVLNVAKNGPAWAGDIAFLAEEYEFRRGLVAWVKLSCADFVARARRLFACAPIQHVTLHAPIPSLKALFAVPWLSQLVSLEITGAGPAFGNAGAVALAKCVRARNLRWVSLTHCGIEEPGVEALAASPHLEQVQYLGLRGNPADLTPSICDDEGFYTASRPPLAAELEKLVGPRPWLALPADPAHWPPYSESFAVTPDDVT
jgi:hypothetical protein